MSSTTADLKREWKLFKDDEPGDRFRNFWKRSKKRSVWFRATWTVLGLALIAGGAVMLVAPGPGVAAIALGLGLLGGISEHIARAMDRVEPPLRRAAGRAVDRWRALPIAAKISLVVAAGILAVVAGYAAWALLR